MESAFPDDGFPSESFWSPLKNARAPQRRTCPPCPHSSPRAWAAPTILVGCSPRVLCRAGLGRASHGQVWQQKALGSSLLPGTLRGPGWGELGAFPLFGVFGGKGGGQGGLYPMRALAGGGRNSGEARCNNFYFLCCQGAEGSGAVPRTGAPCLAQPCMFRLPRRGTQALPFRAHKPLHQTARRPGASSGHVCTGWGRSLAPPLRGQRPGRADVRRDEPSLLLAPGGHLQAPPPRGASSARDASELEGSSQQCHLHTLVSSDRSWEPPSLLVSWTGERISLTLAKDAG